MKLEKFYSTPYDSPSFSYLGAKGAYHSINSINNDDVSRISYGYAGTGYSYLVVPSDGEAISFPLFKLDGSFPTSDCDFVINITGRVF